LALEGEFFAKARMKIAGDATDADKALLRDFQGNIVAAPGATRAALPKS
jgi:hypothetical protein